MKKTRKKRGWMAAGILGLTLMGGVGAGAAIWNEIRRSSNMISQQNLMPEDGLPYFFQFDPQWQNERYGDGTMEETGCGPTSLAMALSGILHHTFSPKEIADYSQTNGYYVDGAGTAWTLFTDYPGQLGIRAWQTEGDEATVQEQLNAGNILILSMGPGDFTRSGHIICAQNAGEPGSLNVHDPNSKNNSRKWPLSTVLAQARAIFVLENMNPVHE